ncbi:Hypothetical predicted protein [Mytilus galloprovincialis]|uniref:Uncharacterized protein n=1 Tax=Mytilus galloprovincialis TaxID=29158 RepID=A0A8B6E1E8_MYTGA|nr:Hypothetical predicted protein [Mytilus galloprovincialis]
MARSKEQGRKQKQKKANKTGGVNKAKTKAVKTNLKHINVNNKSKTEEADNKFDEMREEMIGDVKKEQKTVKNAQKKIASVNSSVSMEDTTSEFAKLGSNAT